MKHVKCVGKAHVLVQTKMHKCSSCKPKMHVHCMCTVRANHDPYGSRLMSRVYLRALNMHFHIIDLSYTCRLFCEYFQKRVELCSCLMPV